MKKNFLTSLTIFLILSCSWKTDFFVLNSSKNSVLINFKYSVDSTKTTPYLEKLKREKPELYEKIKRTPCKFEKEIKNGWFPMLCDENLENCSLLQADEFIYNQDECFIEVTLKPKQSIKLFEICCNYTGPEEEKETEKNDSKSVAKDSNVITLTIKSPDETKVYKGIKLMRAFEKIDKKICA
ncbi:hypothetical protein TAGGR_1881 [Thermodesulfovibrio aggregans]|uniref:Lipoprotein n=1 Tax=Thermodesulfovibrio aggregans TaxID=86166 RepID=A0A0U9HNR0_9BACT|nr:hypothetical protein [Thermodesulfovibrio aggregans]GAQ94696.1 hypothetical protein TAGGR_1881 [Thermodesulfovibrio aggregans]